MVLQVHPLLADGVELVEEEHAGRVATGMLENLVQALLALAKPHIQDVRESDTEEARPELARGGPGDEGFAAARRAVEQQAAAQ